MSVKPLMWIRVRTRARGMAEMERIISFEAPGGTVSIALPEPGQQQPAGTAPGRVPAAGTDEFAKSALVKASKTLDETLEDLSPFLTAFSRKLASAPVELSEASLEVGIAFSAAAGIIFTGVKADGSMKLTVKWKRHSEAS